MCDEERWQVDPGRRAALAAHDTRVRNDGRDDAILYYPGSGADILHALFAAGARTRYFIFVDPADLGRALPAHLRVEHGTPAPLESELIRRVLKIQSTPAGAWVFSVQGMKRHLFHFRMGHDAFIAANRGFVCDIVFEKDFWETEDDVELDSVLQILRVGGHYSTNSSLGGVSAALHMMGLESVGEYDINGSQYLYRRRTATMLDWRRLRTALAASIRVFQELMIDDANVLCFGSGAAPARRIHELLESSPAILAPFAAQGIYLSDAQAAVLCKQIVLKAAGIVRYDYLDVVRGAYG